MEGSENINVWFGKELSTRHQWAYLSSALVAAGGTALLAVAYQLDGLHPLASALSVFYLFVGLRFYMALIFSAIAGVMLSYSFASKCFNVFYEMNLDVRKYVVVMAMLSLLGFHYFLRFLMNTITFLPISTSWATEVLFFSAAIFSSWQTALAANFRWQPTELQLWPHLRLFSRDLVMTCVHDLPRNVARGFMLAIPVVLFFSTFRPTFFDLFFSVRSNLATAALVFITQVIARYCIEIVNVRTMQPLNLPLTPALYFNDLSPSTQKGLINAIASKDKLLKLFGFRALQTLCERNPHARATIFSLSQPAQKPRNWNIVRDVCLQTIEQVRSLIQNETGHSEAPLGFERKGIAEAALNLRSAATPTIRPAARRAFGTSLENQPRLNTSAGSGSAMDSLLDQQPRRRLLLPPQLNPNRNLLIPVEQRKKHYLTEQLPGYPLVKSVMDSLFCTFLRPPPPIATYYLQLCEYAIQTLTTLTCVSVNTRNEDKYGVVQSDLSIIIISMLRLELAIDLYIRTTSSVKIEQTNRIGLQALEDILVTDLRQIYGAFHEYIDAIDLRPSERELLQTLTVAGEEDLH